MTIHEAISDVNTIYSEHTQDTIRSNATGRMNEAEKLADALLTLATVIRAGQLNGNTEGIDA